MVNINAINIETLGIVLYLGFIVEGAKESKTVIKMMAFNFGGYRLVFPQLFFRIFLQVRGSDVSC